MVGLAITDVSKNENPAFIAHISFELKVQTEDDVLRDFLWKIDFLGDGAFFSKKKGKKKTICLSKKQKIIISRVFQKVHLEKMEVSRKLEQKVLSDC